MQKTAAVDVSEKLRESLQKTVRFLQKHPEAVTAPIGALSGVSLAAALQEPETPAKGTKRLAAGTLGGLAGLGFGRAIADSPLYHRAPREASSGAGRAVGTAVGGVLGGTKDLLWDDRGPLGKAITGLAAAYLAAKAGTSAAARTQGAAHIVNEVNAGRSIVNVGKDAVRGLTDMERVLQGAGRFQPPSAIARSGFPYGKFLQHMLAWINYNSLKGAAKAAK